MKKKNIVAALFVLVLFSLFVMGCGSKPLSSDEVATPESENTQTPTTPAAESASSNTTAGESVEVVGNDRVQNVSGAKGGILYASSVPSIANIYLNGERKGTTPYILASITPGTYDLSLSKKGYANHTSKIEIIAGKTTKVKVDLASLNASA